MRRLLILMLGLSLLACTPPAQPAAAPDWSYADLRALDPPDASQPSYDLLAAYLRLDPERLHIRLDGLDFAELPDFDLYLALDSAPGGARQLPIHAQTAFAWDSLLVIPAHGPPQTLRPIAATYTPLAHSALKIRRDPALDTLEISLDRAALDESGPLPGFPPDLRLEVYLTPAGALEPADRLPPIRLQASPPAPAQVVLAFWNVLPAKTPLQALRSWDGAHTGPLGGRHGLANLLRAARDAGAPLLLRELSQPAALSALDALGGLPLARAMAASGLLADPGAQFRLPHAQFLTPADQASPNGPDLATRRALVQTALDSQGAAPLAVPTLVIGGDLPESAWGIPQSAAATLAYLHSRPWIRLLAPGDLALAPLVANFTPPASTGLPGPAMQPSSAQSLMLSSPHVLAVFSLDHGGMLTSLFVADAAGQAHQLVAPAALASPHIPPGGFAGGAPDDSPALLAERRADSLTLSVAGQPIRKTFRLLPDGLSVEITGLSADQPLQTSLPLTFDPWLRFQEGWTRVYQSTLAGPLWTWGDPAGARVEVQTTAAASVAAFTDNLEVLQAPENPDREIPPGFMLPFPMAGLNLSADQDFTTTLRLLK